MPSLSANDVYEVAAGCLPKAKTDFIVRLFRYIVGLPQGQGLLACADIGEKEKIT